MKFNKTLYTLVVTLLVFAAGCDSLVTDTPTRAPLPTSTLAPQDTNTPQNTPITPTEDPTAVTPTVIPVNPEAYDTLRTLQNALVPENNMRDLAMRLLGIDNIPETLPDANPPRLGEQREFWVTNVDTNDSFKVKAKLVEITDSAYFWVETNVSYDIYDMQALAQVFNDQIYLTNREFFGSEWNPGIDGDPRLYVLFARNLGIWLAGYFSSSDSVHPLAHKYSNAHEMFVMNIDNLDLADEFTRGVLAHEFQHMIHWYRDRNEETWLNEGFSELAMFLNNLSTGGSEYSYIWNTDYQLNDWPNSDDTSSSYGAAFLFVTYFLDRFGEEATKALVAHPQNGLESIDLVLEEMNAIDGMTGKLITADDVFVDWTLANYLKDGKVADGRYTYTNNPGSPQARDTKTHSSCPSKWETADVRQYGVDYIKFSCEGTYTIEFKGQQTVSVIPKDAHSGKFAFWSNKGDESDMTLTREFDFTQVSAPITLKYHTWYDLEEDYDYLYLVASEDGARWQILTTPNCTTEDPSGNSYGCGYNGISRGWIEQVVDLSAFAGKKIQLRFEYITDAAVNGEGFLLDDVTIPEIGYATDFETDDGGWMPAGWVRIQNLLPQTFRVTLIKMGAAVTVTPVTLSAEQTFNLTVELQPGEKAILVVSGTTRHTRMEAVYRYRIE